MDSVIMAIGAIPMANEIKAFLARQVSGRRKEAKLSQADLSRLTNISIARISEIERAIANPTLDTLEAIAGVLNVSIVDLLDYEGTLRDTDRIKEKIAESLEYFNENQLQTILSLIRVIRK